MATSFFGGAFFGGEFFNTPTPVVVAGGGGSRKKRRKIVRLSDYANQDEFREAMRQVIVLPTRKVEISGDDDDALLAVLLRTLH